MMLQTMVANEEKTVVPVPQYEAFAQEIADDIVKEQSPKRLKDIREKFNELLVKLVPAREIIWIVVNALLHKLPKPLQHDVLTAAAVYDHRAQIGTKAIMHLEAFAARVMALLKQAPPSK